jgi:hypothetical protein
VTEPPPESAPDPTPEPAEDETLVEETAALVRVLWNGEAPASERRAAGEALERRIREGPVRAEARLALSFHLVPLLHPDLDPVAREAAIRALEALHGETRGYRLDATREDTLEAVRGWYAFLRE